MPNNKNSERSITTARDDYDHTIRSSQMTPQVEI